MMLGARTAAWAKSGGGLPYDYRLEYASNGNGEGYFDALFYLEGGDNVEFIFSSVSNSKGGIFGSRNGAQDRIFAAWGGTDLSAADGSSGSRNYAGNYSGSNNGKKNSIRFEDRNIKLINNGIVLTDVNRNRYSFIANYNCCIAKFNGNPPSDQTGFKPMNFYEFTVDGKHHFIPVLKNGDVAVYDEIGGYFAEKHGTWTAGPIFNP